MISQVNNLAGVSVISHRIKKKTKKNKFKATYTRTGAVPVGKPFLTIQAHQQPIADDQCDPHKHVPSLRYVLDVFLWFQEHKRH